jgi:hypothetical protein
VNASVVVHRSFIKSLFEGGLIMWRKVTILIVIGSMLVFSSGAQAGRDVTGPLDFVVGVPDDGDWPPNELPRFAVDDQVLTKYLHFKGGNVASGIRVTPAAGPTVVNGLTFTSANDARHRNPTSYELSGSNASIDGPYTLIAKGPIVDFTSATWPFRTKTTTPIQFANTVSYKHYQLLFPTIFDRANEPYMQIAEIELLTPVFKATGPVPANGAAYSETWANLTWTPGETAASHDVYFGDNFADVNDGTGGTFRGNQILALSYAIVGLPGFPFPDGLTLGTTYYWRIDQVEANGTTKHRGDVWTFTLPPKTAWNPSPRNGAKFVSVDADLSWSAGSGARLHYVYFGDNLDTVSNATGGAPQPATTYTLATLQPGKTYYWRVDEFDIVATHKGDVWSFTTAGPGGGILGEYFNNTNVSGTPALTRIDPQVNFSWGGGNPGAPLPDNGWSARWTADLDIVFDDTYIFSVNSEGGTRLWIDDKLVVNAWVSWVPTKYASLPIPLKAGIHSLRLEFADWDRNAQQQLSWATPAMADQLIPAGPLQPPALARRPSPLDGSAGVNLMSVPTWKPGYLAVSHEVFFGTDAQAVANATATSPEYKGTKALGAESLDVGKLAFDTTYFWRVDEVNNANPNSPWTGNVWSFWTGNFLVVDDLESYNDIDPPDPASNRIFDKWVDGFATPTTNGAVVGNNLPPYAEVGVLHGGAQSMPYSYDNNLKTSEATLTLVYPRDWTEQGVTRLSLWFQGASTNSAERVFVALNGTAVVYHDNPAATQSKGWNEWVIDLQAFASQGVNLASVNTVTIGVGTKNAPAAGGTGKMYLDDIRLYGPVTAP